ncbi:MAG: AEC family transporter [Oscillospiraceae bacterium]
MGQEAVIVAQQVLLIFIFILIGMIAVWSKLVPKEAGSHLSNICLITVTPAVLISSYQRELNTEHLRGLGLAFLMAAVAHGIAIAVAMLAIRKRKDSRYRVERMAVIFSNCGYMAIPLVSAVMGDIGVYYLSAFIGVFNILLWTVGAVVLGGKEQISLRKAIVNPGVLGLAAGMLLYFLQIKLPTPLDQAVDYMAALNTPLAMITAGIFLSGIKPRYVLKNPRQYYVALLRLIVVPLILLGVIALTGVARWFPGVRDVIMAAVLACACPTAAAVSQFPVRFGQDSEYGAEMVAFTTLLSMGTLPLMNYLVNLIV